MITTTHIQVDEHRYISLSHNHEDDSVYLEVQDESGDAGVKLNEQQIGEVFTAVTILKARVATVKNQKERAQ